MIVCRKIQSAIESCLFKERKSCQIVNQINYRSLEILDAEEVSDIALQAWKFTYKGIFDNYFIEKFIQRNYAPEGLIQQVNSDRSYFHLALAKDRIIGFINIGRRGDAIELFRIYLKPIYVGKGIGKKLLELGEDYIRAQGETKYYCFVHQKNKLGKDFYLRQKFVHIPEKDHEDEWYMEKQLL